MERDLNGPMFLICDRCKMPAKELRAKKETKYKGLCKLCFQEMKLTWDSTKITTK